MTDDEIMIVWQSIRKSDKIIIDFARAIIAAERDEARAIIAELVACKDIRDRMADAVGFDSYLLEAEYLRRKPLAWSTAREWLTNKARAIEDAATPEWSAKNGA